MNTFPKSGTSSTGLAHDKKIADEEDCLYPPDSRLRQDCGFQGYEPENINIVMPFKKPRNGTPTRMQKWFNQYVSQRRIVVEHAIRGIRRFYVFPALRRKNVEPFS